MDGVVAPNPYSCAIRWSEDDQCFVAYCLEPEFAHLSAFGDTREHALAEYNIVMFAVIETYIDSGWQLPPANTIKPVCNRIERN